jgi:hypothetical protein
VPTFKDKALSEEPDLRNSATNTARAMWKRKFPAGQSLPKIKNLAIYIFTSEMEDSLNYLLDEIREICILAVKNKWNQYFCTNTNQDYNNSSNNQNAFNKGQVNKGKKKNKSQNYEAITSWFCNKKGHTHRLTVGPGFDKTNP